MNIDYSPGKRIVIIAVLLFVLLSCTISIDSLWGDDQDEPSKEQKDFGQDLEIAAVAKIWADDSEIPFGECTTVKWHSQGGNARINEYDVTPDGEFEACLEETTTYTLEIFDGAQLLDTSEVIITVLGEQVEPNSQPDEETAPEINEEPTSPPPANTPKPQQPKFSFDFAPKSGPGGTDVILSLSYAVENVSVQFDGRVLPKKVSNGGKTITITIPGDAKSGPIRLTGGGVDSFSNQDFIITQIVNLQEYDLAITDLFPKNMPVGDVYTRLTFNGPASQIDVLVTLKCQAFSTPLPGNFAPSLPINSTQIYRVTQNAGETKAYDTGIQIDTDSFTYVIDCSISSNDFQDIDLGNNSYSEIIP